MRRGRADILSGVLEIAQRENDEAREAGKPQKWFHLFLDFDEEGRAIVYSNADNPHDDLSDVEGAYEELDGMRPIDLRTRDGATLLLSVRGAEIDGEIAALDGSESKALFDFDDGSVFVCRADYENLNYTLPMWVDGVSDIAYVGHVDGFDFHLIED